MSDILTNNKQVDVRDQILMNLMNQFNMMGMEIELIYELLCDTDEKKKMYKEKLEAKVKDYMNQVKSAQIKANLKI